MGGAVDLHSHTTASDGTLGPAELVREAVRRGRARPRRDRPRFDGGPRRGHGGGRAPSAAPDRARHRDQLRHRGRGDPHPRLLHGLRDALVSGLLPSPAARAARARPPHGGPARRARHAHRSGGGLRHRAGRLGGPPSRRAGHARPRLREDRARSLRQVPRLGQAGPCPAREADAGGRRAPHQEGGRRARHRASRSRGSRRAHPGAGGRGAHGDRVLLLRALRGADSQLRANVPGFGARRDGRLRLPRAPRPRGQPRRPEHPHGRVGASSRPRPPKPGRRARKGDRGRGIPRLDLSDPVPAACRPK